MEGWLGVLVVYVYVIGVLAVVGWALVRMFGGFRRHSH